MGRLGGTTRQQCWGRDLLNLPAGDQGIGMIKPSGGGQTVALVKGGQILVQPRDLPARLYDYRLGHDAKVSLATDTAAEAQMKDTLDAFIQTATRSLKENTAGAVGQP